MLRQLTAESLPSTLIVVFALVTIVGCSSSQPTTHRYLLTEPVTHTSPPPQCRGNEGVLAVTVSIPDYLQRSGIVLALNDNEIRSARGHRWSEPLATGIRRMLESRLPALTGVLEVEVRHFHGHRNGRVILDAQWRVTRAEQSHSGEFVAEREQTNSGYGALVNVHRELLTAMASEIQKQMVVSLCSESLTG